MDLAMADSLSAIANRLRLAERATGDCRAIAECDVAMFGLIASRSAIFVCSVPPPQPRLTGCECEQGPPLSAIFL
jgi:hypothetical protein